QPAALEIAGEVLQRADVGGAVIHPAALQHARDPGGPLPDDEGLVEQIQYVVHDPEVLFYLELRVCWFVARPTDAGGERELVQGARKELSQLFFRFDAARRIGDDRDEPPSVRRSGEEGQQPAESVHDRCGHAWSEV